MENFECGPYEFMSTTGESYDSDTYVNAQCINNTLRTSMYLIYTVLQGLLAITGLVRVTQLWNSRQKRAFFIGATCAAFIPVFYFLEKLCLLFNEKYGLRYICISFGSACTLVATTSVMFNWYQAQALSHFNRHAERLISRAYRATWLSNVAVNVPFLFVFSIGGYLASNGNIFTGNLLLGVGQIVGAAYGIICSFGIMHVQKRLLRIIREVLQFADPLQKQELEATIRKYAHTQTGNFAFMSLSTLALGLYGICTSQTIYSGRYFFYIKQFALEPGLLGMTVTHLLSTRTSVSNRVTSVSDSEDTSKRRSQVASQPKEMSSISKGQDQSMEVFLTVPTASDIDLSKQ